MSKRRTMLIVAAVLLVLGITICGISLAVLGFNFKSLSSADFVTSKYEIKEHFEDIAINGDTANIALVPSEDGQCRVVCYEDRRQLHRVKVENGTLYINKSDEKVWHIGLYIGSTSITVYLPDSAYNSLLVNSDTGDVSVPSDFSFERVNVELDTGDIELSASAPYIALRTDTGRISLHDITARDISLETSTGRTIADNVSCEGRLELDTDTGRTDISNVTLTDLNSSGNTGSLYLTNVIASGELRVNRDTGDVRFDGCDAAAIYVETDTGKVTGTLLSDKIFLTETDTGRIDVPKSITGGRCEITTDTGDIKLSIQ